MGEPRYAGSHGSLCSRHLHRIHPDRYSDQCDCGIEAWGATLLRLAEAREARLLEDLHDEQDYAGLLGDALLRLGHHVYAKHESVTQYDAMSARACGIESCLAALAAPEPEAEALAPTEPEAENVRLLEAAKLADEKASLLHDAIYAAQGLDDAERHTMSDIVWAIHAPLRAALAPTEPEVERSGELTIMDERKEDAP